MWLLLLVALFISMGILDNPDLEACQLFVLSRNNGCRAAYTFNGPETPELSLEILFVGFIAETRDYQGLECVASDIWVILRVI